MSEKLPAIQLYPGDWLRDQVAGCSLAAQGLWLRMMFIAHDSDRYGYLGIDGAPMPPEFIARRCGATPEQYATLLSELDAAKVPSRTAEGIIFSRRMVKDAQKRLIARRNGRKGGNPHVKGMVNRQVNQNPEDENEDENTKGKGERGKPVSEFQQFTDYFCLAWSKLHGGEDYGFGKSDGVVAAALWSELDKDLAKAKRVIDGYLADASDFYRGHKLSKLKSDWRRFLAVGNGRASRPAAVPAGREDY